MAKDSKKSALQKMVKQTFAEPTYNSTFTDSPWWDTMGKNMGGAKKKRKKRIQELMDLHLEKGRRSDKEMQRNGPQGTPLFPQAEKLSRTA